MYILTASLDSSFLRCTMYISKVDTVYHQSEKSVMKTLSQAKPSDLVLVTGASGYVAGHCILRLLSDGYAVRGTLRSLRRADEVRQWLTKAQGGIDCGDNLSFVEAELTDPKSWDGAMERVRYVLHVASPIPSSLPK